MNASKNVADELVFERGRQKQREGWTLEHDDGHNKGELALAAATYALTATGVHSDSPLIHALWPWDRGWWKPKTPRRDLIRAGALIIAEIERLDRGEGHE